MSSRAYANVLKQARQGSGRDCAHAEDFRAQRRGEDLLGFLIRESGRPVTFLALFQRDDIPEACTRARRRVKALSGGGAADLAAALTREVNMRNPFSFAAYQCWGRVFADKSEAAQRAVYADPAFRNAFRDALKDPIGFAATGRVSPCMRRRSRN